MILFTNKSVVVWWLSIKLSFGIAYSIAWNGHSSSKFKLRVTVGMIYEEMRVIGDVLSNYCAKYRLNLTYRHSQDIRLLFKPWTKKCSLNITSSLTGLLERGVVEL
jgi:hypothetical protein